MKKPIWQIIAAMIILAGLFIYGIINAIKTNQVELYFDVPLYAIINIAIVIVFAYYLTQYKNDTRRKKEIVEGIINKLLDDFSNERMYIISSEESINHIRITQRSINNRLSLLKEYDQLFDLGEDTKYVLDNFNTYSQTISNHISDLQHLMKSKDELLNLVTNITNRLEKMIVHLYA